VDCDPRSSLSIASVNDEIQLIQSALRGDSASFGILVSRHQDRLFSCVLNIMGDPDETEDVVQESFIQAYLKLDTFQHNSQFFTWLYRIAFNNALSRRRRRRPTLSLDLARESSGSEPNSPGEQPDANLIRLEKIEQLRDALLELSDDHRIILTLREMQEKSYEDIAEILEISIGTVRSRLSRARNALKAQLELSQDWR
jgi:RNA polymerase sigma-70 factor (ECF subfamily)